MSERRDGGPAFPRGDGGYSPTEDGMSLRDWFAGQAVIAIMTSPNLGKVIGKDRVDEADVALASYLLADKMLAERAK